MEFPLKAGQARIKPLIKSREKVLSEEKIKIDLTNLIP
jgi:hypothetical protein